MYGCDSWTLKKAEHRRIDAFIFNCLNFFWIDAFELWYWRSLLRVPWTSRRFNQSILKVISPKYPLEGLMLKLKLQYFGHLMWRTDSLEKTLMVGKIECRNRREQQDDTVGWHHRLIDMCLSKVWELVMNREAWHAAVHGVTKSRTWLGDWTEVLHKKWKHYNTFVPITLGWAEFRLPQKFLDQVYLVVPLRHVKYKIEALFSFFHHVHHHLKFIRRK